MVRELIYGSESLTRYRRQCKIEVHVRVHVHKKPLKIKEIEKQITKITKVYNYFVRFQT